MNVGVPSDEIYGVSPGESPVISEGCKSASQA